MGYSSETLEKLVRAFASLPGIGEKSAQRIALFLLTDGRDTADNLSRIILELKEKVRNCSICYNLTDEDPCNICRDARRDFHTLCVVEEPKDLLAIEKTGSYRGLYHVLGGSLSPLDGVGEEDLRLEELIKRVGGDVSEVIIATNPTVEGEMTAARLAKLLRPLQVKITRIARGIPFGGSLEFNDAVTVAKAIEGRLEL